MSTIETKYRKWLNHPEAHVAKGPMTFIDMLKEVRKRHSQKVIADGIDYSVQYVSDLENGRRLPSVAVVNAICRWMGRGPKGRLEWHLAAARANGWEV